MCFKVWEEGFKDGSADSKMVVRWWKNEFLLFEKIKHIQLIYLYLCFITCSSYPTTSKE